MIPGACPAAAYGIRIELNWQAAVFMASIDAMKPKGLQRFNQGLCSLNLDS
jgi:hypothetical protein